MSRSNRGITALGSICLIRYAMGEWGYQTRRVDFGSSFILRKPSAIDEDKRMGLCQTPRMLPTTARFECCTVGISKENEGPPGLSAHHACASQKRRMEDEAERCFNMTAVISILIHFTTFHGGFSGGAKPRADWTTWHSKDCQHCWVAMNFFTARWKKTQSLKAVVIIFCTTFKAVNAAIWTPGRSSVVRIPDNGARFYFNNGGQIQAIANTAGNSTNPSTCNSWVNGTLNFTPFGVSNVAPSSAIASVAYWAIDPTTIAIAPLGMNINAFTASDSTGTAIVFISWENALGQLTESWTADVNDLAASWSAPMVIST
ncbi:hypothetical protein K438DRAFT_1776333 [Mycena galopus ATCC 62051]|nr:hypothetical protein K438DRAFT_1776333 [Mycena galopus ATCC 62051]